MGDRPSMKGDGKPYDNRRSANSRNSPAVIKDEPQRARSQPASSKNGSASTSAAPSSGAIDTLRLFLMSRYSTQEKLLNLENMAEDTILNKAGLKAPGEKGAPANLPKVVWKLVSELFPDIVSLSLANNGFTSILPLSPFIMTTNVPNLQNLSLAANQLRHIRDLDPLSPTVGVPRRDQEQKGWPNLRELVLTGNPIADVKEEKALLHYRSEMARRFPSLRQLDQQPLDPSLAFVVKPPAAANDGVSPGLSSAAKREQSKSARATAPTFPVPVAGAFVEAEHTREFVAGFLAKYFAAYDSDRSTLLAAYAPTCTFSFCVDTTPPVRTRAKKVGGHGDTKFPNQFKLDWKPYLSDSRNLDRVSGPGRRVGNLLTKPDDVVAKLNGLPKTVHPLSDAPKFVFDSWTMPGILAPATPDGPGETAIYVTVHGEFKELPSKGIRSFDRTFLLAPVPAGSPAAAAGWPCVVLSDLFTVRGYTDPSAWAPKPVPSAGGAPNGNVASTSNGPSNNATPQAVGTERAEGVVRPRFNHPFLLSVTDHAWKQTDEQQALVLQLQSVTRLTYQFAHLCLVQNGWDPATALANFQSLHAAGQVPPEGFLP